MYLKVCQMFLLQILSKMKQLEEKNSQKLADILIKVVPKGESENQ